MEPRKLKFSSGAEWLLGAFGLLRRSPLGLGGLGALIGLVVVALTLPGIGTPALAVPLQLVLALVMPLLMGAMVWAAHQVDSGASVGPGDITRGAQGGRAPRLLMLLLPNVVLSLVAVLLLFVLLGREQITLLLSAFETIQAQAQSNPQSQPGAEVFDGIAMGRLGLWLMLLVPLGILAGLATFTAYAGVVVGGRGGIEAMLESLRGCLRNLGPVLLFFGLAIITVMGLTMLIQIVALIARLIAGDAAMMVVMNLLLMAVFMPLMAGSTYFAWKQMFAEGTHGSGHPAPPTQGGFEA